MWSLISLSLSRVLKLVLVRLEGLPLLFSSFPLSASSLAFLVCPLPSLLERSAWEQGQKRKVRKGETRTREKRREKE